MSMHVITVGQSKGGVGKTTIAINVAAEISRLGCSVTVIDFDPQRSAVMWAEPKRLDFTVREELLDDGNVTGWIRNILKLQTDIVVIDTRSGLDKTFETAVFISDLVVVPCGPSSLDILSARRTVLRTRELASANANQHTRGYRADAGGFPAKKVVNYVGAGKHHHLDGPASQL